MKEKREEDEMKMKGKELETREREQGMRERKQRVRERELEGRLERDLDLSCVLRQQLQQQQAIWSNYSSKINCCCTFTKTAWKRRNSFTSQHIGAVGLMI